MRWRRRRNQCGEEAAEWKGTARRGAVYKEGAGGEVHVTAGAEGARGGRRGRAEWSGGPTGVAFGPGSNHVHPADGTGGEGETAEEKCTRLLLSAQGGRKEGHTKPWRVAGWWVVGRPA
jgi:hypothetical protein